MKRISGFPAYERVTEFSSEAEFDLPCQLTSRSSPIPPWRLQKCTLIRLTNERKETLSEIAVQCMFHDFREKYEDYVFIYTDGSKTPEGVGCAYAVGNLSERLKLPHNATIFVAEAVAILGALTYIRENEVMQCVICTDSLSILTALQGYASSHPMITQIREFSHELMTRDRELIIAWIPGHCNIAGNEFADAQAKRAIRENNAIEFDMAPSDYYPTLRLAVSRLFNKTWQQYNPNTTLKMIKDEAGPWESSRRSNRREEVVLCRMRIGHTRFTHGYLLDRDEQPECDRCGCPLTVNHILVECPTYTAHRQQLEQLCRTLDLPLSLKSILGDRFPELIDEVFTFLRASDLLKKL